MQFMVTSNILTNYLEVKMSKRAMTTTATTLVAAMTAGTIIAAWKLYGKANTKEYGGYRRTRRGGKNYIEKVQYRPR